METRAELRVPALIIGQTEKPRPHPHSAGSRLAQNTIFNVLGQAIIIALTFFSTPYITRKLGAAQYGALSLLMTYLFAFSLLNLGMNTSLVKYLAELIPKDRLSDMQNYFSTSLTVLVAIGLLIGTAVYVGAPWITRKCFNGSPEQAVSTVLALRIASFAFTFQFVIQVLSAVSAAAQRFDILNVVRAGSEGLRIVGTVALLSLGYGLPTLMGMVLVASLCACLAYAFAAKRLMPALKIVPAFSRMHFGSLLSHSRFVLVTNVSNQLVSTADNALIGFFLPIESVAYYSIPYTLAQRMWAFVANIVSVVFPAASAFAGAKKESHIQELYLRGMKVAAAAAGFPAVALCVFSRPFLLYWLGPDYAREGALVLSVLAIGFMVNSLSYVAYQLLQSTDHADTAAKAAVGYSVLNLALFVLLIPPFRILGAAVAFLIAQLLFVPWFVGRANRLLNVPWRTVVTVSYLRAFIAAGVTFLTCWACRPWVHSFFSLALAVAFASIVYTAAVATMVLDARERATCLFLLHRWTYSLRERVYRA